MEARARRIVVIGALVVIAASIAALSIAAQPAIVIQRDTSIVDQLSAVAHDVVARPPSPYEVSAGSPWLRLVFVPMILVGVLLVARPRVAGAVMWSLASLGVGAVLLILRTVAPHGLPTGAQVTDLWPRTVLPIAIAAIFVAHAGLLAALAQASRRRPRAPLPRAVARVP